MLNTHNKNKVDASHLYLQHKRRLNGVHHSKKLIDLMLVIQQHRAASLASLGGDVFFENRIVNIQKEIRRLLTALNQNDEKLLSKQELKQLNGEWLTIRRQWQKDSVMQNFLLHSHLITLILKMNKSICSRTGHDQLNSQHCSLAHFCLDDVPQLIEAAAQARGLATHCAAQQSNPVAIVSKINFLIDEIKRLDAASQITLAYCSIENYHIVQRSRTASNSQHYRDQFLAQLNTHFSQQTEPTLLSGEIYASGSQFVMATNVVLAKAYKLMSACIDDNMQAWIYRSNDQS